MILRDNDSLRDGDAQAEVILEGLCREVAPGKAIIFDPGAIFPVSSRELLGQYGRARGTTRVVPVGLIVRRDLEFAVKKGSIVLGTVFVLLAAACSGGSTALTVAASTTAVPPATSTTTSPDTTEPPPATNVTVPAPDPTDIKNYVAESGSVPTLAQPAGCVGAAGVCLFQPVKPVVDRLGPEDQRYGEPSADYRTWVRPGLVLTIRSDETGSITRVTVTVDGDAVVAASDGALIGSTTIGEMRVSDVFPTECYSGFEGQVFLFYTYPGNNDGSAIVSFGESFRVGDSSAPQRYGPELDAVTIRFFEASTTGSVCEVSPP